MKRNSNNGSAPEDVKPCWMNVVRAAQAACAGNNGYGIIDIRVAVNGNVAVLWETKLTKKLSPRSAANIEMTEETAAALMAHMGLD
jgi:hypothetical protein